MTLLAMAFNEAEFNAALIPAVARLELEGTAKLSLLGKSVEKNAKVKCPKDTGKTADSITTKEGRDIRGPWVDVGTWNSAGLFLEFGTKPHVIAVKTASVLTDGTRFFGTHVNHPGTTAKPFLRPAFMEEIALWGAAKAL